MAGRKETALPRKQGLKLSKSQAATNTVQKETALPRKQGLKRLAADSGANYSV